VIFVPKIYATRLAERRYPNRYELDQAAPRHAAMADNGYASVLNSAALRKLGIEVRHALPGMQGLHEPPQSWSVSLPFWMPSMQLAALQVCVARLQAPLWQSVFAPDVPRFKYIGSTIKLIAEGRTPGGPWTNVESVDAEIRRNPVLRYGPSLTPTVLVPIREVDLSATFTHDPDQLDWDFVTASATGSVTGEEESQNLAQGSVDITFGRHPADATKFIRVYSGPPIGTEGTGTYDTAPFSANWEFDAQLPDPDPGGGPIDINAAGRLIDPPEDPGESEVTVLLAGGKSSAYLT